MNSHICYKLTDSRMQTYGATQWVVGETKRTSGEGRLCGPGWLHWYDDPIVALLMNPVHAWFVTPRLFVAEWGGRRKDDSGLKSGSTALTLTQEVLPVPTVTPMQRVAFGILAALEVTKQASWREWAERWLSGEDRTIAAASAAERAADHAVRAAVEVAHAAAEHGAGYPFACCAVQTAAYATKVLDLPMIAAWAMAFGGDV